MEIRLLENPESIRKEFLKTFVLSWEVFQEKQKDWIGQMAASGYTIDLAWYEKAYMWDRMDPDFPRIPFKEAITFLRNKTGNVLFMSEDISHHGPRHLYFQNQKHIGFVAQGSSSDLADLIEEEWFEDYRLEMENRYNPNPVLPTDLYVFDPAMKWCMVFTHETTDWESEIEDPMKAAQSRYCILCGR